MESVNALVTITGIKYKEIAVTSFRHAKISFYVISQVSKRHCPYEKGNSCQVLRTLRNLMSALSQYSRQDPWRTHAVIPQQNSLVQNYRWTYTINLSCFFKQFLKISTNSELFKLRKN
jgi:hypothetical protein